MYLAIDIVQLTIIFLYPEAQTPIPDHTFRCPAWITRVWTNNDRRQRAPRVYFIPRNPRMPHK